MALAVTVTVTVTVTAAAATAAARRQWHWLPGPNALRVLARAGPRRPSESDRAVRLRLKLPGA